MVINILTKMISPGVHAPVIQFAVKEYKEGKDKRGRRFCTDSGKRVPCRGGPTPTPKAPAKPKVDPAEKQRLKKEKDDAKATAKTEKDKAKQAAKTEKDKAKQAAVQKKQEAEQAIEKAKQTAKQIARNPEAATIEQVQDIGNVLITLKLNELKELKAELGIKAGTTKAAIVEQIKNQALGKLGKPKPAPASPAPAPKSKPPGKQVSLAEARKFLGSGKWDEALEKKAAQFVKKYAVDQGVQETTGLAPEPMKGVNIGGASLMWGEGVDEESINRTVVAFVKTLHPTLLKVNKNIRLTSKECTENEEMAKVYGKPGLKAVATADAFGNITAYQSTPLTTSTMAHESGHSLGHQLWGGSAPPPDSEYGIARQKEPPVTEYGETNGAEDFAEACMMYNEEDDRKILKKKFPLKYAAVDKIMKGKAAPYKAKTAPSAKEEHAYQDSDKSEHVPIPTQAEPPKPAPEAPKPTQPVPPTVGPGPAKPPVTPEEDEDVYLGGGDDEDVFLDPGPARPIDHLVAGVEIAEEAKRDANGFLDKDGQNAVLAAFQGMDDEDVDLSPGPPMKCLRMKYKSLRLLRERKGM